MKPQNELLVVKYPFDIGWHVAKTTIYSQATLSYETLF